MAKIENEYVQQVLKARSVLASAKSEYNSNVAKAKKNVKEAQATYDKLVKSLKADKARTEKEFAESLKSYAGIKLYNDHIEFDGQSIKFDKDFTADVNVVEESTDVKSLSVTFTWPEGSIKAYGDAEKEELARNFTSAVLSAKTDYPDKLARQNERIALLDGKLEEAMNATDPIRAAERRLDEVAAKTEDITQAESELHRIEASGSPTDKELLKQAESSKRKTTLLIAAGIVIVILVVVLVVLFLDS